MDNVSDICNLILHSDYFKHVVLVTICHCISLAENPLCLLVLRLCRCRINVALRERTYPWPLARIYWWCKNWVVNKIYLAWYINCWMLPSPTCQKLSFEYYKVGQASKVMFPVQIFSKKGKLLLVFFIVVCGVYFSKPFNQTRTTPSQWGGRWKQQEKVTETQVWKTWTNITNKYTKTSF